jgi:proline dehydrogenase
MSSDVCARAILTRTRYSGMGPSTLRRLKANAAPSSREAEAIHRVCSAALAKRIRVSPAAEPQNAQKAVNDWTLDLARIYNKHTHAHVGEDHSSARVMETPALIYNTYQCYLKSTPQTLLDDIQLAEKEGFTPGVKLVRGAYLATEERELIYAEKKGTDEAYDGLAAALLKGTFEGPLAAAKERMTTKQGRGEKRSDSKTAMKRVDVLLATHNLSTVEMALSVREKRVAELESWKAKNPSETNEASPTPLGDLSFAQLQGMADEVSCALLAAQRQAATTAAPALPKTETYCRGPAPHVYKYCNWVCCFKTRVVKDEGRFADLL